MDFDWKIKMRILRTEEFGFKKLICFLGSYSSAPKQRQRGVVTWTRGARRVRVAASVVDRAEVYESAHSSVALVP